MPEGPERLYRIVLQCIGFPRTVVRLRGDLSLALLLETLEEHIRPSVRRVLVEYRDDEGDTITVSSEDEWRECVVVGGNGAGVVKLRVTGVEREGRTVSADILENFDVEPTFEPEMIPTFSSGTDEGCA